MKKPFYQAMLEFIAYAFSCIVVINTVVEIVNRTIPLIDLTLAMQLSIVLLVIHVVLMILFKYRKIRWVGKNGEHLHVVRFNKGISWCFVSMLLILWAGPAAQLVQQMRYEEKQPVFSRADKRLKVLIPPFDKECDYMGKKYDIGEAIQRRLESMKRRDNLNLVTHYLTDSIDYRNFTHETADSLMKHHNADIILYGFYSFKQCEGGTSDKICFNYQTNVKRFGVEEMEETAYKMHDIKGMDEVRMGTGQEGFDYVIYWIGGMSAEKEKKYDAAIATFKKIKNYQASAHILYEMGNCYFYKNDYATATQHLQNAVTIDSTLAEAWGHLGVIAASNKRVSEGVALLEKGLKAKPDNFCVLRNLGLINLNLKDTAKAKKYFEEIVKTNPESDIVLQYVATLFRGARDYDRAMELLGMSLKIHSFHPETWNILGQVYRDIGDTDKAMECFKKALWLKPEYVSALHYMGLVYLETKRYDEAKNTFNKVVMLNPGMENAWYSLGLTYILLKKEDKAINCLQKALSINKNFKEVLYYLGMLHKKLRHYELSDVYLKRLAAIDAVRK